MLMGKRSSRGALGLRLAEPGGIAKVERWSPATPIRAISWTGSPRSPAGSTRSRILGRGAVGRGRHRAPLGGRRNADRVVSSATLPGPSLLCGLGSLFGRFNSVFARLGNSFRSLMKSNT